MSFIGLLKDGVNGVNGLSSAFDVTLSPNNEHVYVNAAGDDSVSWFNRDASTGDLSFVGILKDQVNGVDGLDGYGSVVLTPDESLAYISAATDNSLSWFERDATSGALTYLGILKDGINGVDGLNTAGGLSLAADEMQMFVADKGCHKLV